MLVMALLLKDTKIVSKSCLHFKGVVWVFFLILFNIHYKILCHVSIYCHPVLRDVKYFRFYVIYHESLRPCYLYIRPKTYRPILSIYVVV